MNSVDGEGIHPLLRDPLDAGRFAEARQVFGWYAPLLRQGTEPTRALRLPLVGEERERIRHGIAHRPTAKG